MFSKDTSFQNALASVPGELRTAMSSQGHDQPGVLVAYVEDIMAEGTGGTGDTLLGISTVVLIFPIATSLPSSSSGLAVVTDLEVDSRCFELGGCPGRRLQDVSALSCSTLDTYSCTCLRGSHIFSCGVLSRILKSILVVSSCAGWCAR